jgi:hypothetical protein
MAFGPRKKGPGRRLVTRPRLQRRKPLPTASRQFWRPAADPEREAQEQSSLSGLTIQPIPQPCCDAAVFESNWTLDAFAARTARRLGESVSTPQHAPQSLLEAAILESDWTLAAYRTRAEKIAATPASPAGSGARENATPGLRLDFRPIRLDEPTVETRPQARDFWVRSLAYAASVVIVVAIGAAAFRPASTVETAPAISKTPQNGGLRPPPAAPLPATNNFESAPPVEPRKTADPEFSAGDVPPVAGPASPAAKTPPAVPDRAETDAPTPGKAEPRPAQAPAVSSGPPRPTEGRPAASAPRKARAPESRHNAMREPSRAQRGISGWFDDMVKSVKRLGRALTP